MIVSYLETSIFSPITPVCSIKESAIFLPSSSNPFSSSKEAGLLFNARSAIFSAKATKSAFLATKSVSQLTSTTIPDLPSAVALAMITPSLESRS
ncbi:hypothetical protein D3C73_1349700 [compost metagenome]